MLEKFKLSHILIAQIVIWAGCCIAVHGTAILVYLALQAVTSGVFAWGIHRSYSKQIQRQDSSKVVRMQEPAASALQPATARQAG